LNEIFDAVFVESLDEEFQCLLAGLCFFDTGAIPLPLGSTIIVHQTACAHDAQQFSDRIRRRRIRQTIADLRDRQWSFAP
jgi:hypothetical protein